MKHKHDFLHDDPVTDWLFTHLGKIILAIGVLAILLIVIQLIGIGYFIANPETISTWLSRVLPK